MAKKKSFILYADYIKHIGKLTDEEAGRLFKAIFEYVNEGRLPDLDGMAAMAFSFISNQLDSDLQKYETVCQKRAESAKRRWQKNDDAEGINNDVEKECKSMQMHTNAVTCINLHSKSEYSCGKCSEHCMKNCEISKLCGTSWHKEPCISCIHNPYRINHKWNGKEWVKND